MDLGDYNPSWVANGESAGIQAESGVVYPNSDTDTGYHWHDSTFSADQFAEVVVAASAVGLFIGPAVRAADTGANTYYGYYASSTARYLVKSVDSVITELGSTTTSGVVASDILRLEVIGNKLTPFINSVKDTLVGSHSDSSIASGNAGLAAIGLGSGTSLSSWSGGMIGSVPVNYSEFAAAPFGAPEIQMEALTQINGIAPDAVLAPTLQPGEPPDKAACVNLSSLGGNLSAAITAAASNPDKCIYAPAGTYTANGHFTFDGIKMIGDGDSTVFNAPDPDNREFALQGDSPGFYHFKMTTIGTVRNAIDDAVAINLGTNNWVVHNITIDGGNAAGIICYGGHDGRITNNRVSNTLADSIHMTDGSYRIYVANNVVRNSGDDMIACVSYDNAMGVVTDILVENNDISGSTTARGLSALGAYDITYRNNTVADTYMAGLYIVSELAYDTTEVRNVLVTDNSFDNVSTAGIHSGILILADTAYYVYDVFLKNCAITNISVDPISLDWTPGKVINISCSGNTLDGVPINTSGCTGNPAVVTGATITSDLLVTTNLSGTVDAIQDDPDAPTGAWLTAVSPALSTDLRVSFPSLAWPLSPGATQSFRYLVRKTIGTGTPTLTAELRENNVLRKTLATEIPVTSLSGTVLQGDWLDSDIVDTSGANVELRLLSSPGAAASVLQHFCKSDGTARTTTSTTPVELTNYTVTWANLTASGFVAGDNALIIIAAKHWGSAANSNYFFAVGFGTTFAGRVEDTTSVQRAEPAGTAAGHQYLWVKRRTLVVNENIYFRGQAVSGTASYDEFVCFILNWDDIPASDKLYAEATHSGNAPTTYGTAGAGAATPSAGDWWLVATSKWLVDGVAEDMFLAINDGTIDAAEVSSESEDAADERVIGTMAYRPGLGSGVTVRARYREAGATAPPDINATTIFGLRLDTFSDHWGVRTTNTITHSVIDTYQTFASNGSYVLNNTGPFVVFGWPIHLTTEGTKRPYGRIRINAVDWLTTTTNRSSIMDNGASQRIAPLLFGYNASQPAATFNLILQAAEDVDIAPTYTCAEQVAVAFSLFRGSGANNTIEYGAIKWNASVDAPFSDARTVNADAVVQKRLFSPALSANAAVAKRFSVGPAADSAVRKQISATANADAALLLSTITLATTANSVVLKTIQTITSANAGVSIVRTALTSPTAVVRKALQVATSADSVVLLPAGFVAVDAGAVVYLARTAATSADAGIAATGTIATSGNAVVTSVPTAALTADAAVILVGRTAGVSADGAVLKVVSRTTSVDGAARTTFTIQLAADAVVMVGRTVQTELDVDVLASLTVAVGADLWITSPGTAGVVVDAALQKETVALLVANAVVATIPMLNAAADAAAAVTMAIVVGHDSVVLQALSVSVDLDAYAVAQVTIEASASADATVAATYDIASAADASISVVREIACAADISVIAPSANQLITTADAAVYTSLTITSSANAWLAVSNSLSTEADAVASKTFAATLGASVNVAIGPQIPSFADVAILANDITRVVSMDVWVSLYDPVLYIPGDGYTLVRLAESRIVTTPASPRTIVIPAILRTVTAPAVIPPEVS